MLNAREVFLRSGLSSQFSAFKNREYQISDVEDILYGLFCMDITRPQIAQKAHQEYATVLLISKVAYGMIQEESERLYNLYYPYTDNVLLTKEYNGVKPYHIYNLLCEIAGEYTDAEHLSRVCSVDLETVHFVLDNKCGYFR